jgi:Cellulase (glycosyl hydrolase family 5)
MRRLSQIAIASLLTAVSLVRADPSPAQSATTFTVSNGQVLQNGTPFVVRGVNISGFQDDWRGLDMTEAKHVESITNCWGFNAVRARNYILTNPGDAVNSAPDYLDRIISAYTSRGRVVILEAHDRTGSYYEGGDLVALKKFHVDYAKRYKNNPYVWFNIMNEPDSNTGSGPSSRWVTMHREVIGAIRAVAPNNMIVVDAASYGQDAADFSIERPEVSASYSSLLTSANAVMQNNTNIVFSFHTYQQWGADDFLDKTQANANARMRTYLDALQAKKIPTIIGEYGSWNNDSDSMPAVRAVDTVAIPRGIGHIAWAWGGYDNDRLVQPTSAGSAGWQINDCANPTNLTELGKVAWRSTHPEVARCPGSDDWDVRNIGKPYLVGSACLTNDSVKVTGSGTDIWGTADQFMFTSKTLGGDGQVTARISGIDPTHPWAKGGVMLRTSLEGSSPFALLALTPSNGIAFQFRKAAGSSAQSDAPRPTANGPTWLRLTRAGSLITAFTSPNGSQWTQVGSTNIDLGNAMRAGLSVTAHQPDLLATSTFDNVRITGANTLPDPTLTGAQPLVVYADALSPGWTDGSWNTTKNPTSTSPVRVGINAFAANYQAAWSGVRFDSAASVDMTGVKGLSLWVHGGTAGINAVLNVESATGVSSRYMRIIAPANTWTLFSFSAEQLGSPPQIQRVVIKDDTGKAQGLFSIDQLQFDR